MLRIFFEFYHYEKSPDLCFILDEYYAALGQEALTSKFSQTIIGSIKGAVALIN